MQRFIRDWLTAKVLSALGVFSLTLFAPKAAMAAEAVQVTLGPIALSLSTESLAKFEATGELTPEMRYYAQFASPAQLAQLRQALQRRFQLNPVAIAQFSYSPLGEQALQRLGKVVQTASGQDGFYALRSALILSAADPQGLSILGFIRNYPTQRIRIRGEQLLELSQELVAVLDYRDAAVRAIAQAAQTEATPLPDLAALPNPRLPGRFRPLRRQIELRRDRQTLTGQAIERRFRVLMFFPERPSQQGGIQPAPVVVISHGLGSTPEAFAYLGQHLASHGFVAVLPQHIGSDASRAQGVLSGVLGSPATPVEFIDRPLDITFVLNELERRAASDPLYRGRMNLQQVGVIGHSFGGYTALALAGAELNFRRIRQDCASDTITLNLSPLLQCLAQRLPPFNYPLRDRRVKAAIAISPLSSIVFGPEGLGRIQIPTLLVAGSSDVVASAVPEQIHPFLWLQTPEKYLAVMIPSGHTFSDNTQGDQDLFGGIGGLGELLSGPDPVTAREYVELLSLGFIQTYLNNQTQYRAFLNPAYAQSISQEPLRLNIVRSLTSEQLTQAFGRTPPIPFVPALAMPPVANRNEAVLQEIARTGVLRAAIDLGTSPFGLLDASGQPAGVCVDWLTLLTEQLQQRLQQPVRLQLVPTTLVDRYEGVRRGEVQIECGANSIRTDLPGIQFSNPFFLTGTHLLVPAAQSSDPRFLATLTGVRVGVLSGTQNATVLQRQYPEARLVPLESQVGVAGGVRSLAQGQIEAFASDGILLIAEARRQNLLQSYTLIPQNPLSCEAYGMALPNNDPQWQTLVNDLLSSPQAQPLWDRWFTNLYPYVLLNLDFCAERSPEITTRVLRSN